MKILTTIFAEAKGKPILTAGVATLIFAAMFLFGPLDLLVSGGLLSTLAISAAAGVGVSALASSIGWMVTRRQLSPETPIQTVSKLDK